MKLQKVAFIGFKGGVILDGGAPVAAENVMFVDVDRPFDVKNSSEVKMDNVIVAHSADYTQPDTGYASRPNYPPLPSYCDKCKSVFPSRSYFFSVTKLTVLSATEPCPTCKHHSAHFSRGTFEIAREFIRIISAPDFTHVSFEALRIILETNQGSSPDELSILFQPISEELANFISLFIRDPAFANIVALLTFIATIWFGLHPISSENYPSQKSSPSYSNSVDGNLGLILKNLPIIQQPTQHNQGHNTYNPTDHKSILESGSLKDLKGRGSKAKVLRRKSGLARRKAFGGARQK